MSDELRKASGEPPLLNYICTNSESHHRHMTPMHTFTRVVTSVAIVLLVTGRAIIAGQEYPLQSTDGVTLHNVTAEPATLQGRNGLRLTMSEEARREQRQVEQLARIKGVEFSNGVIEVEIAGAPAPDAPAGARGFVGIAFRLQPDNQTYDAFYLRPTNGRADDQERRNHSVQYISLPEWTWSRLRKETPWKYESYVDLVPGVWTKIKIEVRGSQARLFVHDNEQPTLIVKDVKSGAQGKGGVALWLDAGTVAHFRNLRVTPEK